MRSILMILTIVPFVIVGCGTTNFKTMEETAETPTQELTNHFWLLESLNGETVTHPDDPRKIGFQLLADEDRISGFGGCNQFFGGYTLGSSNSIRFSGMASTKMACLTSTFDENAFLRSFENVDGYQIKDNQLDLLQSGNVVATFMKIEKDSPIVDKYWKLMTLDGNKVEMAEGQEREAYFMLKNHDKRLTGFAGCNTFSGTFSLEKENKVSFSKIIATLRACPDLDFNEHNFLKIFSESVTYSIEGDLLSLYADNGETTATFEAVYFN